MNSTTIGRTSLFNIEFDSVFFHAEIVWFFSVSFNILDMLNIRAFKAFDV